ncbi:MAG: hypothetical protein EHM28_02000 [Spirochaetaceae bacterium]|nr:MAG: hypothetical protein EHM28_02000 [Spirochaetaceae bacterium]
MADIETLIRKNSIVKRLIAEGNLSQEYLKKIFRNLCKITHPDLDKKPGEEAGREEAGAAFIRLKDEYEEAKSNLERLQSYLLGNGRGGDVLGARDIERMFYDSLRHYLAAGLYSVRMRIRPELKKRNELILREIVYWAKLHDPVFIGVFLIYNKTYLRRFSEWQRRDNLIKAQKLFQRGFSTTVEYAGNKSPHTLRTARLCFSDATSLAGSLKTHPLARSILECIIWFQAELDRLSGKKDVKGGEAESPQALEPETETVDNEPEYPEPELPDDDSQNGES